MKEYVNNSIPFYQLVGGQYGRKIAYTDVQSITNQNIEQVVAEGLKVHNENKPIFSYLWNYYKGDQPVHYRIKTASTRDDVNFKICENHAYEYVQFKVGQSYGEPIQMISRKDNNEINKAVDEYNDYMVDADKHAKNIKAGEWQSATGTGFVAVQQKIKEEIPFRLVSPTPMNTFIIYARETEEPLLSVQELINENGEDYNLCFSKNMQFILEKGKLTDDKPHAFGDIPIAEYPNNWERMSDIELIMDLLDAANEYQSNRLDSVAIFVSSWMKFVNCEVDEEQFKRMKMLGALVVKSNNGSEYKSDVDLLTQELNQSETQVAKDDMLEQANSILGVPGKQGNTGGDTQGAVELRNGWDFSKSRAKLKDPIIKMSEKRLAKVVLNVLRVSGKDLGITTRDFDIQINHSPTDNMVVKCQSLQYLLQCGIHPLIAIKTVQLWGDAEKTFLMSQPYLDNLWKTLEQAQKEGQEEQAKKLAEEFKKAENKEELLNENVKKD